MVFSQCKKYQNIVIYNKLKHTHTHTNVLLCSHKVIKY